MGGGRGGVRPHAWARGLRTARSGRSRRPRWVVLLGILAALVALSSPIAGLLPSHPAPALPPSRGAPGTLGASARPLGPHPAVPNPSGSGLYYTQIGATLSTINGSSSILGIPTVSETIPLVTSPYPIGYELNGLSNSGDWYQVLVGDNWPGCSSGFEEILEVWDSSGNSGPVVCDPSVSLSQGNLVLLTLRFDTSGRACLGLDDTSTSRSHEVCQSQPDSGGSLFSLLGTSANLNGYYTGTMTEIANDTPSACPDYTHMPTVSFDFPSWVRITQYVPWSDEFLYGGSICYSHQGALVTISKGDPSSHYVDTASGTSYGPHWVEGQNDTAMDSSYGFRFQTDPRPIVSSDLTASTTTPQLGDVVTLHSTTTGGVSPYGTLWKVDGAYESSFSSEWWNFSTDFPGNYTFTAYGTDQQGDVSSGHSVLVVEPFPLWVGPIVSATGHGMDLGQTARFHANVYGGYLWVAYTWTGLPSGCLAPNASAVSCLPGSPGTDAVALQVQDAAGTTLSTGTYSFVVSTDPAVNLTSNGSARDVGQSIRFTAIVSGGSGGFAYAWGDLPTGCASNTTIADCPLTAPGIWVVTLAATDSNHVSATSPSVEVEAFSPPTASVKGAAGPIDVGAPLELNGTVANGAGGWTYQWIGLPPGCASVNALALRCQPTEAGTFSILFAATDRAGVTADSEDLSVRVVPAPSLYLNVSAPPYLAPANVTFTPALYGGSNVTSVTWTGVPLGCRAAGLSAFTCADLSVGAYSVSLSVRDSGGGNATAAVHLNVTERPAPPTSPSSTIAWPELAGILTVAAVAIGAIAIAVRRRRRDRVRS